MPRASANGIELEYETFGDPGDQPRGLVSGSGAQVVRRQESFCELLASRGFFVIRFDNRDVGLSTWMDGAGPPDLAAAFQGEGHPAYQLDDMADDVAGLLDSLGIPAAHLAGASTGGFSAQRRATNHPDRLLSLTSTMSGRDGSDEVTAAHAGRARAPGGGTRSEGGGGGPRPRAAGSRDAPPFPRPHRRARRDQPADRGPGGPGLFRVALRAAARACLPCLSRGASRRTGFGGRWPRRGHRGRASVAIASGGGGRGQLCRRTLPDLHPG